MSDFTSSVLWADHFHHNTRAGIDPGAMPAGFLTGQGWLWAHLALSDQRSRDLVRRLEDVPSEARALLLGEDCGPRILFEGAWAFGVLPDFRVEFDGHVEGMGRLRFAFDDRRLITARRHAMQTVHDIHRRVEAGAVVFATPLDAFLALSRRYCELAEDQAELLSVDLDKIEDGVLGGDGDLDGVNLGPLRRELSRRHREIAALRTAYHRAGARHGPGLAHPIAARLPMLLQQTEDADHELAALQDRARLVHEELDTRLNSEANRTLHALTVMSALLLPPTLIVGAFGMNLKGIVFGDDGQGFAIVCALCAATVGGVYIALKRFRVLR